VTNNTNLKITLNAFQTYPQTIQITAPELSL